MSCESKMGGNHVALMARRQDLIRPGATFNKETGNLDFVLQRYANNKPQEVVKPSEDIIDTPGEIVVFDSKAQSTAA